jgi:hypothetical protein
MSDANQTATSDPSNSPANPETQDTQAVAAKIPANTEAVRLKALETNPNFDKEHDLKPFTFGFRTVEDETTKVKTKRANVDLTIPVLSYEGIIAILTAGQGTKEYKLLTDAIDTVYIDFVKSKLGDDPALTSDNFPIAEVTWAAIANQPESERRGRGISKEIWDDFIKSYIEFMPAATGKSKENITKQAAVFAQKLQPLKNHEDKEKLIPLMMDMLTVYATSSPVAETFAECITFLKKKGEDLLKVDTDANLMKNLGF